MKLIQTGVTTLALVAGALAALPGPQAQAAPTDGRSVVQRMQAEATHGARVTTARTTGEVSSVRAAARGDLLPSVAADSAASAARKATAYLDEYAAAFGASSDQLTRAGVTATSHGWTVRYDQTYRGLPVFGGRLLANLDESGDLTSVNGFVAPDLRLGTTPRVSEASAAERAVSIVRAKPSSEGTSATGLRAAATTLSVYRMGSTRGIPGANVLAWVVEVTNGADVREMVFLDALTGKQVNRYSMIHAALDRQVEEADGSSDPEEFEVVWSEGDPFPGDLTEPQQDLVVGTGESYWFFMNTFGRDSYDGEGHQMRTVNNDGRISCPNANWNGETTNYCTDVTADDTVAHEWGHAYTEYTSGLVYQWQSGAMNEAFSDIWGETVDMVNGRQDEAPDTVRPEGQCSKYTRGAIGVTINSPAEIAGPCEAAPASWGPVFDKTGVTTDVVVGQDPADDEGPSATDGCSPFDNAAEIAGSFVYVDRGTCTFQQKADNAEAAGATGVIIGNNVSDPPFSPSGTAGIYGLMIDQASGSKIKSATGTVNVTIKDVDEDTKADSYRWLSSEGDAAFGGAIRDMWNPNCYGDPGKVSDAQYWCSYDDGGGVHSNSGVVNHAYALLVDGSTYNGETIAGIGLDKAANIFWRTQESYLTPTSNFADLATGLTSSCNDLVGQEINQVSTQEDDAQPVAEEDRIQAEDCASVAAVIRAVELEKEPTQCNFKPILAKKAPALCGKKFRTRTLWKENFQKGLKRWKKGEDVVYDGASGIDWRTGTAPGGHRGKVAVGPAPDEGDCSATASDISSANSITSPAVRIRRGAAPKLSFQHYVATEYGYDGGNLKISVNGKRFKVVPDKAYRYNAPNAVLATEAEGNSNPLAGEPGWTGTDGNVAGGSWGTSIVNLKKVGASKGDRIRIRFEIGRDGCGGIDGWYVDNVKVTVCKKKHKRHRVVAGRD